MGLDDGPHDGLLDDELTGSALRTLLDGHWYDAVAALLDGPPGQLMPPDQLVRARALATAARRVLDLDAEDFAKIAHGFAEPWAARLADASFPTEPLEPNRGALGSLVPLYELMLEVLEVRALRREPLGVVVSAHLIGEYLLQLAWESTLGHAGDPLHLAEFVGGSRWGSDDRTCAHPSALRATAKRALHATDGDQAGFTSYLDRYHSRQGDALGVCAMNHLTIEAGERPDVGPTCPLPCDFVADLPLERRRDLDARVRLARIYVESPLVELRHHAPVGHFFGVPSVPEISAAWLRTWDKLTLPWPDGSNPLLAPKLVSRAGRDEALPGLSALVSAVAGQPVGPGRLLHDIGHDVAGALSRAPSSRR